MYKDKDILITGSKGLVGSELAKLYPNSILIKHQDYDLRKEKDVELMFKTYKPKCVIHSAGKVGGVVDNLANPATYFDDNILMNTFMVKYSHLNGVERFIGILSSCIFPDTSNKYPLELCNLHDGPPSYTNFSYAYSKRCLAVQIDAYNKQYGTRYNYLMPSNMYGENDKFDYQKGHFIPTLLLKIKQAVKRGDDHVLLLGDGKPLRQFMHAKDFAYVIKYVIDNNIYENFEIANEENLSIDEMAKIALIATDNIHLQIIYQSNTPNGQFRKDVSTEKLKQIIPKYKFTKLADGIKEIYNKIKI
jgi:GDP-L-fucose synthase